MNVIRYKGGYKYQLQATFELVTAIYPVKAGGNDFVSLSETGLLLIGAGYAWDGASGPAIDTKTIMRASLVHDALYQLIRLGAIAMRDRDRVDQLFRAICLEDGMWPPRAWWCYQAVHVFGELYMHANSDRVISAP